MNLSTGNARLLLIVLGMVLMTVTGIVLTLWAGLDVLIAFNSIGGLILLVIGGLMNAAGSRQGSDATVAGAETVTNGGPKPDYKTRAEAVERVGGWDTSLYDVTSPKRPPPKKKPANGKGK